MPDTDKAPAVSTYLYRGILKFCKAGIEILAVTISIVPPFRHGMFTFAILLD